MLSDAERAEIEEELSHYPDNQAGSVEALKVVQRHRGWVSDESLKSVAALLGMTSAELDSVATFYNLIFRKPVGRHVIFLCDSISCWVCGCDAMRNSLQNRLGISMGQTTLDGRFTLLPIVCLGACDRAPTMMVNDDLHEDLTAEKINRVLEQYP
ncbi:MAG: NADH-quinone oxidoreductase subunit NuoE [Nitrospira sp.]|nr:NADH-quinone oxidoreductase subunit NuoE [Nitrospira sp.]